MCVTIMLEQVKINMEKIIEKIMRGFNPSFFYIIFSIQHHTGKDIWSIIV